MYPSGPSKVHRANMGPTWEPTGLSWAPCWPHESCYLGGPPPVIKALKEQRCHRIVLTHYHKIHGYVGIFNISQVNPRLRIKPTTTT